MTPKKQTKKEMGEIRMIDKFNYHEIERIVYIWARYAGTRDATKEGKHYSKTDLNELIRRLEKFKDNPDSFDNGFERDEELKERINKIGMKLAELQEIFIIKEMLPYFENDKLMQKIKLRLKENRDAKEEGIKTGKRLEREEELKFWKYNFHPELFEIKKCWFCKISNTLVMKRIKMLEGEK